MFLHRLVLTVALAVPLAVGAPGAHGAASAAVTIDGLDVEQVTALGSGAQLRFSVYGTPYASVTLRIEGGWHVLALRESEPGIYEGTYVIDSRDAIVASSRVTATLQHDGQLATAALEGPLVLAAAPLPWADAARAQGQVAAAASPPPTPAVTAPSPVPVPAPRVDPAPVIVAPVSTPAPPARAVAAPSVVVARAPQRVSCDDCAFVQSVHLVEPVPGGPIGAVAGAIAGAVLGKELGEAHHRRMLALLGALGGAFAGHEIGKQATQQRAQYDVVLRTGDGRSHTLRFDHAPSFAPGDTVRFDAVRGEALPAPL